MDLRTVYMRISEPLGKTVGNIDNRIKNTVIFLAVSVIFMLAESQKSSKFIIDDFSLIRIMSGFGGRKRAFIALIMLVIIVVASLKEDLERVRWNIQKVFIWELLCLTIVTAGMLHSVGYGYMSMQVIMMFAFPCLYSVRECGGNQEEFYDIVSHAVIVIMTALGIYTIIVYPFSYMETMGYTRYDGFENNPNSVAITAVTAIIASLYVIMRKERIWQYIAMFSLGLSITFLVLSESRTSILAMLIVVIAWLIMYFRQGEKIKYLLGVILISSVAFGAAYTTATRGIRNAETSLSAIKDNFNAYAEEVKKHASAENAGNAGHTESSVSVVRSGSGELTSQAAAKSVNASSDEKIGAKNTTLKTDNAESAGADNSKSIAERFERKGDLNTITTGRVGIWRTFIASTDYCGADVKYFKPLRIMYYDGHTKFYSSAHNTIIDVMFRAGIPAGILLLLLEISACIYCLKKIFAKKGKLRECEMLTVMAVIAFCFIGLFENTYKIFKMDIFIMFCMTLAPFFRSKIGEEGENQKLSTREK